jgi:serine protease AprX
MSILMKQRQHEHSHAQNRFAVLPNPVRLASDDRYTGKGVTIAFIDSGFYPHPDLTEPVNRIQAFEDVTCPGAKFSGDREPKSWDWHGTQTSVVAAGNGHLSEGIYRGLAPDAQIVLAKVSEHGKITEENIARGLKWVIDNKERYNIRVVSISLGGDEDVPYKDNLVDQTAEEAVSRGLVVVVAAGNSGNSETHTPVPPANSPSVITVGGYDDKNSLGVNPFELYWSSFGPTTDGLVKPEIIAPAIWVAAPMLPGTEVYEKAEVLSQIAYAPDYLLKSISQLADQSDYVLSAFASELWRKTELPESLRREAPDVIRTMAEIKLSESKIVATHYQHVDGTSFAAPIVASVVAQMIEANPDLTPAAIKHILISTADRIPGVQVMRQGYGVLNARRAVEEASRERHADTACFFCPPRIESGKLVFDYHHDSAETVALAGDFNDWNPTHTFFTRLNNGLWRTEIEPPTPGRYRYKLIVNQSHWIDDPGNLMKEPDNYGGLNSVINLVSSAITAQEMREKSAKGMASEG